MICPNCGNEVQEGTKFCRNCGKNLSDVSAESNAAAEPKEAEANAEANAESESSEQTAEPKEAEAKAEVNTESAAPEQTAEPKEAEAGASATNNTASGIPMPNIPAGNAAMGSAAMGSAAMGSVPMGSTPMGSAPAAAAAKEPKNSSAAKIIVPVLIGALLFAAVIAVIVIVIANMPKKVNLNEYLSVEFEGYDTLGTAQIKYDKDMLEVMGKAMGISDRAISKLDSVDELLNGNEEDFSRDVRKLRACIETLDISLDKTKDLSNGETVTMKVKFDNEDAKEYKIKFVGEDATFSVKGLEEIDIIDAFANYIVSFEGIAPEGYAYGEYTGPDRIADGNYRLDTYYFSMDKSYPLRNGDKITVTLNYSEDDLLRQGYKFKEMSKEYTVEGLEEYVDSYSDLTSEYLAYAKAEANDTIAAYVAKNSYNLDSLEYAGYIFDSPKPDVDFWGNYNDLFLIYKGMISYESNDTTKVEPVYFPVQFYNILSGSEGLNGRKNDSIYGYFYLPDSWYSSNGYMNPVLAYAELVGSKSENYNIESGDGFEVYGEYTTVTSLSDLSDANLQTLDSKAITTINDYIISSYNSTSSASDTAVAGYYLLSAKEPSSYLSNTNRIYVVYQATVSSSQNNFETTTVYFPVEFCGIVTLSNGEIVYAENNGVKGYSYLNSNSWWSSYSTRGYLDGSTMFDELVTQNRVSYTYEVSDGLKQFGE